MHVKLTVVPNHTVTYANRFKSKSSFKYILGELALPQVSFFMLKKN